jgi:hypothetical protein
VGRQRDLHVSGVQRRERRRQAEELVPEGRGVGDRLGARQPLQQLLLLRAAQHRAGAGA